MVNTDRLCMGCMNDNGGEKICPICGYDASDDNSSEHLAVGTWLNANRYLIGRVIDESGDGVTYIGWDNDLNAVVNIKEYFPQGIAVRAADRMTVLPADGKGVAFGRGMEDFAALFSKLATLPESMAILRIADVFEACGTVYSVAGTVSGTTLKAFLLRQGGTLKWEQVKALFMPLLATVSELNDAGIIHRGICPDNIIVGRDGKLRLTGFCIRDAEVEHTEFLSRMASGYAAPEQYLENDPYGASCDVYALGAVIFRCLIGIAPPDAKDRLMSDKLSIPAKVTETVPRGVLVAVANTLKVDRTERIPTVSRFYKMLEAVATNTVMLSDIKEDKVVHSAEKAKKGSGKAVVISSLITALVFIIAIVVAFYMFGFKDKLFPAASSSVGNSSGASSLPGAASSGYAPDAVLFEVPDLINAVYADIYGDLQTEYKEFKFEVAGRLPSDKVPKGSICKQSIDGGTKCVRDTVIQIYISQGSDTVIMPNVVGMSLSEAKAALFDKGFYSDTIIVSKGFSADVKPGCVYKVTRGSGDVSLSSGEKVSINELIVLYYLEESAGTGAGTTEDGNEGGTVE